MYINSKKWKNYRKRKFKKVVNMKKFSKNNIIKMIIISLLLLLFGTGYYAYSLNQKYINIKYNEYN